MVLRAKEPKRSPISSCAGPKTRRKSLARNVPNFLAANAVIVFTDHLQDGKRCYHFAKELKGEKRRSVRFQRERSPLGLTVPRMLLVCADEVIEKGRCLLRCMSPVLAHRDMPTASDNVRFREKTGSSPPTAKMKRLTPTGRCAPQGRNCGILRQTRWDGSMKRRTLKWHLLLVLSVPVSCDCTRI